ncbi:hypothetical protein O181_024267 [Austropuccinia psidii MF-1]|uniref:Uncharacterized protein n=1 Tax=Austropuccinia psidii MF-1 TaxID=1389203 RepID=A0A9Q3CIZ4_9BASI|nr:hypothetical protein [Austropuccinia psidii MF-1]
MAQTLVNSTEFNEQPTSAPESGSEISDMASCHELGIEVESHSHKDNKDPPVLPESQPPSSQKPNFKSYEKEKTVEPCLPTEDAGKDDVIFSGEVEIILKEQFVSNIAQTIPRLEKIQNDGKIPDYVRQKISEAMSLLKMDLNSAKDSWDQDDEMINVEVHHIDNQPPHTESPPILNETIHDEPPHTESPPILNEKIHDETPPTSPRNIQAFQEREKIKHYTMGQDMTDIIPDPEPKVSSSANFQKIFLSCMEEFGDILNYHPNTTQKSWKRGIDNINRIYKT